MALWNELARRGVLRTLVVYVGVAWGLVQGADFFVSRYQWTDGLVDLLLVTLLALLPLVLGLAWLIGAEGRMPHRGKVWAVAAGYAVVAVGAVWLGMGRAPLGRATTTVQVTDEQGREVAREVPRADLLRAIAISPLRATGDAPNWLAYGLSDMLMLDLSQHRFLVPSSLFNPDMRTAIRANDGRAPLAVMAQLARDQGASFLLDGEVWGSLEASHARLVLYRADPVRELHRLDLGPLPLTELADAASLAIKPHLQLNAERAAAGDHDLPVVELYSRVPQALTLLLQANADTFDRDDLLSASAKAQEAIRLDPGFALAGLRLNLYGVYTNQWEHRHLGIQVAMAHLARLPEPIQCQVRIADASLKADIPRAERIARSCVELYPQDAPSRQTWASFLALDATRIDAAIEQWQALYDLGPVHDNALLQMARLYALQGNVTAATESIQRYRERHPDDPDSAVQLADLLQREGRFDEARELLLDAQARRDAFPLALALSQLHARLGEFERAESLLRGWQESAQANDRISAQFALGAVLHAQGQHGAGTRMREQAVAAVPESQRPVARMQLLSQNREHELRVRGWPEVKAELDALLPGDSIQVRMQRAMAGLQFALELSDPVLLQTMRDQVADALLTFSRQDLHFWLLLADAHSAELLADGPTAARQYAAAWAAWTVSTTRVGINELQLLDRWARTALLGAPMAAVAPAIDQLARGWPGLPMAQLRLAEIERRADNPAADARLQALSALLREADPDSPLRMRLQALQDSTPATNPVNPP